MLTILHFMFLLLVCETIVLVTSFLNYDTSYILDYIKNREYPIEVHNVKTVDGFVLTIHRIPHGIANGVDLNRKGVVLLNHGLEESSEHWIINGNKSLAFLLPDEGYDVWMMNARGTYHSNYHAKYDKRDSRYWNFSWHEIGIYDLPAVIDHILKETKVSNISYIGHSQGCTSFFVLTSEKPEYNDKFNLMIGLAPAVYMKHVTNPIFRTLSNVWEFIYPNKGLLDNAFINILVQSLCQNRLAMQAICTNAVFFFGGYDYEQLDDSIMLEVTRSAPAGASTKQLIHYVQLVRSGYFRKYDYLTMENLNRYGTTVPPDYNLSKVTTNIALYYAKNDRLSVPKDVQKLRKELINANVVVDKLIDFEMFNHFDFLFAKDVVPLIYDHVIETLNDYN